MDVNYETLQELCLKIFNYRLREEQVNDIILQLSEKDNFIIKRSGYGKTTVAVLPAFMNKGCIVIISPLISGIGRMAEEFKKNSINYIKWCSGSTYTDNFYLYNPNHIINDKIKIIITTPEDIRKNEKILPIIEHLNSKNYVQRYVFDEAHVISTYPLDSRNSYLKIIISLKDEKYKIPATFLSDALSDDDLFYLCYYWEISEDNRNISRDSMIHKNINIEVKRSENYEDIQNIEYINVDYLLLNKDKILFILHLLRTRFQNRSGMIYAYGVTVNNISTFLTINNIRNLALHDKMIDSDRSPIVNGWINNSVNILIATSAVGLGINPNADFVIHYDVPQTFASYVNMIGRVGSKNRQADAIALYDFSTIQMYKDKIFNTQIMATETKIEEVNILFNNEKHATLKNENLCELFDLINFMEDTYTCRHYLMNKHSEDAFFTCSDHCDNCLRKKEVLVKLDVTHKLKSVLQFIKNLENLKIHATINELITWLTGIVNTKADINKLYLVPSFGILLGYRKQYIRQIIFHCLEQKLMKQMSILAGEIEHYADAVTIKLSNTNCNIQNACIIYYYPTIDEDFKNFDEYIEKCIITVTKIDFKKICHTHDLDYFDAYQEYNVKQLINNAPMNKVDLFNLLLRQPFDVPNIFENCLVENIKLFNCIKHDDFDYNETQWIEQSIIKFERRNLRINDTNDTDSNFSSSTPIDWDDDYNQSVADLNKLLNKQLEYECGISCKKFKSEKIERIERLIIQNLQYLQCEFDDSLRLPENITDFNSSKLPQSAVYYILFFLQFLNIKSQYKVCKIIEYLPNLKHFERTNFNTLYKSMQRMQVNYEKFKRLNKLQIEYLSSLELF